MPTPKDTALYERAKKKVYPKYDKPSAYRSGALVKEYKKMYEDKHGSTAAYGGTKENTGLTRWYKEDWKNQRGETGYSKKGDVYRPTKRVTKDTPKTFNELNKSQVKTAMKKKASGRRVDKF